MNYTQTQIPWKGHWLPMSRVPYGTEVPVMAIYWKGLKELDVYYESKVCTYRGADADELLLTLRQNHVNVEEME
jgi:hypothetical protein